MVIAGWGPGPSGRKSQPRSVTPPSAPNATSSRWTMEQPPRCDQGRALAGMTENDGNGGSAPVEVLGVEHAVQPAAQFGGEPVDDAERPVVDGGPDDLPVRVLRQD